MKNIALGVFLLFFSTIMSLLALEGGVRIWLKLKTAPKEWNDRPAFYFQQESSATLQDYAYDIKTKPDNTFRIAVVGDSYSFAPYMQFTDSFAKVLERMLNLNNSSLKAEVINYGVPGYSANHEIAAVKDAITAQADLILMQITLNDAEVKPWRPTGIRVFNRWGLPELSGWQKTAADYSKLMQMIFLGIENRKSRDQYKRYHQMLFENPQTWGMYEKSTRKIVSLSNEASKQIVAVVFPLFGFPLDAQYPFHNAHSKVKTLYKELNVPTLDLYSTFEGIPLERIHVIPGKDRHPNEIAHRMAAEAIYSWLLKQNLIPEPLKIKKLYKGRTQIIKEEPFSF